jgi:integrase
MQGKRTHAVDSRGRRVRGLYVRDGKFEAGFSCPQTGRWRMLVLDAQSLTEARRERESVLAGLREGRLAAPASVTFGHLFAEYQDARNLSERTRHHEQHLLRRHLDAFRARKAQDVTAVEIARLLRGLRGKYSSWTCLAVYRIIRGSFAIGVRRGIVTRSPIDGLAPSEIPKQQNARRIAVLDSQTLDRLIAAGSSERWRAALALGGYGGLRLGEIRGMQWQDIDLDAGIVHVRRSLTPDGTPKQPKTAAGVRGVPLLPALRRSLVRGSSGRRTPGRVTS